MSEVFMKVTLGFILLLVVLFSQTAKAAFMIDWQLGYASHSENKTSLAFNDMSNHFFFGATLGGKEKFYFGQNITYQTHEYKTPASTKITTMELGPRMNWYFNEAKSTYMALAWNPYAKGTRVAAGAASEDISGWSYLVGFGYELKISKNFHLGASINYHALNISKAEVNNVSTEESTSYTSLTPMLNLSFRFR